MVATLKLLENYQEQIFSRTKSAKQKEANLKNSPPIMTLDKLLSSSPSETLACEKTTSQIRSFFFFLIGNISEVLNY
jgi:hypothetical protein